MILLSYIRHSLSKCLYNELFLQWKMLTVHRLSKRTYTYDCAHEKSVLVTIFTEQTDNVIERSHDLFPLFASRCFELVIEYKMYL